jgi:hypothetical protein
MSIKNKFATAVATASLLAGLFGSAFVPSALAAREVPLDKPSVAVTETWTSNDDYIVPVLGSNGTVTGADRSFWMTLIDDLEVDNEHMTDDVFAAVETDDNDQYIEYVLNTKNGDPVEEADLKATSSSSIIKLAWSYDNDGTDDPCEGVDGTFGSTDTVTEVPGLDTANTAGVETNSYALCVYSNGKPGTATIAVVANGVTLAPVTITVVGDIASITVVADGSYVAEDNDAVSNFFTVTAKDSAGTIINGPSTGVSGGVYLDGDFTFTYGEGNPVNQQDDDIDFIDAAANSNGAELATGVDNYSYNQHDLNALTCVSETATGENDGDAGKSYTVAVEVENDDEDLVTSATMTITCTGPADDAKLSKFEVEATSGDLEYTDAVDDVISVYGYFVDQAGRPLGAGADIDLDDDFVLDISANATFEGDLNIVLEAGVTTNGTTKVEIATLAPNMGYVAKFPYTISVESSDLQSATAVAKSLATFYTATNADAEVYTLTRVRNAAKTRATITVNFGAECSNQMVDFDVELANGDVKFVERRANIDGVAVLTIERRNTKIYVKAFCNDGAQESNLRGIRFR